MHRPKTMGDFEREWLARGGTVVRDNSGHVLFKYPGIPAGAVHQPRSTGTDRVPRHLLSRLRRIQEGRVVSPPRVPEPSIAIEPEKIERPRLVQRSNPQRPFSVAPYNPAAVQDPATPGSMHLLNGARRALRLFYLFHDVHELGHPDGPNALVVSPCTQECCGLWAHHDRLVWSGKVVGPQPGPIEPWEA